MCKVSEVERECGFGEESKSSGDILKVSVLPREGTYFMPMLGKFTV